MGNTSSSQSGSPASGGATSPRGTPQPTTTSSPSSATVHRPTNISIPAPPQPLSTAIHSGLTPPTKPASPEPPSTPPLLPFGGHLSPQNPHALSHPQAHDYSKTIVTSLVLEGRLAPFYRGLEDWEEDYTEEDVHRILDELREKDLAEGVQNSVTELMKADRETHAQSLGSVKKMISIHKHHQARDRLQEEREQRDKREKRAYLGAMECPICFLNYPPNINTSRCCQQPICTECFVQMKRSEATITHLESDPACCPFCMETDFGVIYERPPDISLTSGSDSALGVSPEASTSAFSQALSVGSADAELSVGPGMAPKVQEKLRRKSVSAKAQEVVTVDQIRPDWEEKLNAVKAAAARRASRRIVMRQVGDRLIPVGYTSSRATGQADFSASLGQDSGGATPRRNRRRDSDRSRDLEELMIMEAMRLSLVDHEDHQRKIADDRGKRRDSDTRSTASKASKLFSKFGNRSRSGSTASANKLGMSIGSPSSRASISSATGSQIALALPTSPQQGRSSPPPPRPIAAPSPVSAMNPQIPLANVPEGQSISAPLLDEAPPRVSASSSRSIPHLHPRQATTVAPVTTLDSVSAPLASSPRGAAADGLPRLSMDMPTLTPDASRKSVTFNPTSTLPQAGRLPLDRADSSISEASEATARPYAALDSPTEV